MKILKSKWPSLLGLFGLVGFISKPDGGANYFMFVFFIFFAWGIFVKLDEEQEDERLRANKDKAIKITFAGFGLLCYFILFFLDRGTVSNDTILFWGTLGYSFLFILGPVLTYYFDRIQ